MSASVPYATFAARSLALCTPPIRRPATRCKLHQVLGEFGQICPTTAHINLDAIAAWLNSRPERAPLTSFSLLRSFARAVKLAAKQELIRLNPFEAMPPSQWFATGALDAPERIRHLTVDQIGLMLKQSAKEAQGGDWEALRMACLLPIYAYTGCRRNEALGLMLEDLDLLEGVIWIRPNARRPLKTRAARRRLPMHRRVKQAAMAWIPECRSAWLIPHKGLSGPWLHGRPGCKPLDRVKALGERAGVPGATILAIRHGFATAVERLSSELLRQRFLGHRSAKTQYGYGHEDLDQLRCVTDQICYD
jgi:integrase